MKLENVNLQENVKITKVHVTKQLTKKPNWKVPGLDSICGFSLKRFTSQHKGLTEELNKNMHSLLIPSWLVKSRTGPAKGNVAGNYQPITCLNLLLKLKKGIIADKLYQHLENEN